MTSFVWNIDPIAFEIFGRDVRYYSLCFIAALFSSYIGLLYLVPIFRNNRFNPDILMLGGVFGVAAGTRLFHLVFYQWSDFSADPMMFFDFSRGGLASHGALVFCAAWVYLFARISKLTFFDVGDVCAVFAPLSAFWVRIGNFFNSEIVGLPTSSVPWAVTFQHVDQIPRHPVQLYEALLLLATFGTLLYGTLKRDWLNRRAWNTGLFLAMYFGGRFFVEFTKELQVPGAETWLTMGQWLSIIPALCGLGLLVRSRNKVLPFRSADSK